MKKILIQFDTDAMPSCFDRVVAVDAGVDDLFSYGGISTENVVGLVHGAIFTRGPGSLKNTAIFIGGSRVADGEAILRKVQASYYGPMRVSVMMDSNGCNTTAAAAVVAAAQHLDISATRAVVLGGTGPVGHRVVQILASQGANVRLVSRSAERAAETCDLIRTQTESGTLEPAGAATVDELLNCCHGRELVVAAGAAGVCFLPTGVLSQLGDAAVAIDLNAVPPVGIADIGVTDKAKVIGGTTCYGAIGVGGIKMKIHRAAVASLFEANDRVLDTPEIFSLAQNIQNA